MHSNHFFYSAEFDFLSYKQAKSCSNSLTNFDSHAHGGYELLYVIEGTPTYGFEENSLLLNPGDILITPPQLYHFLQIEPNDNYERISLVFFPKQLNLSVNLEKVIRLSDNHKILRRQLKDFSFYYEHCDERDWKEIFEIKMRELIFTINHLLPSNDIFLDYTVNATLKNILQYINANIKKNINVSDISKYCFLSEGHVFHLFNEKLNTSPMHYIKTKKMLLAQSLISQLDNKQGINAIAQDLGYDDYSVFYRNYLKFFGHKPSDDLQKF